MEATVTYKCPNCDAGLTFDASKGKFTCEFCCSEFTEEELRSTDSAERAEEAARQNAAFAGEMREYYCPSCGAEVLVDKSTAADFCYYCHNPVVLSDKVSGAFRPDKIVPFKFDRKEAGDIFLRYAKKKIFAPRDYFSPEHADKIQGIYYPFWVTDADTAASLEATGKTVRTWRVGNIIYTETSNYRIHRGGMIHFEDISSSALSETDKAMLEGILPYPADVHEDFSMPYLLGFQAKKRDVERTALHGEVQARMKNYATELLRNTIHGYSAVMVQGLNMRVSDSHWNYTLFPVWMLTYERRGKRYVYAMNGYTGKIYGELPVSPLRLGLFFGALAVLLTVLFGLIGGLLLW